MATVTATAVKEAVKETLVGTTIEPQLSVQAQIHFEKHARKDENDELYMTEEDFVNAIAPQSEDYVSPAPFHMNPFETSP